MLARDELPLVAEANHTGLITRKPYETAGVIAVALTWPPGLPRDPAPLLRQFTLAADGPNHAISGRHRFGADMTPLSSVTARAHG